MTRAGTSRAFPASHLEKEDAPMLPRHSLSATLILVAFALPLLAEQTPVSWRDSTRDVYLDGALDRRAQVLVSSETPPRMAILSERLPRLIILDPASGTVLEAQKSAMTLSRDRLTATLEGRLRKAGTLSSTTDGVHQVRIGRRTLLLKPHVSTAGPMRVDAL